MEKRVIKVEKRFLNTKHSVKELRKKGFVPGVLYGKKIGSIPISVQETDLGKLGGAHLYEVTLPGGAYPAVIREIQKHPISGELRHVDFQQVELDKKIRTEIPVLAVGVPAGQKNGGVLQLGERTVEIEAFPDDIPDYLEVDVTNLEIGDKYTVADLQKITSFKIIGEMESVIASVVAPRTAESGEGHGIETGEDNT